MWRMKREILTEETRLLAKCGRRWKDIIEMVTREAGCEGEDGIQRVRPSQTKVLTEGWRLVRSVS